MRHALRTVVVTAASLAVLAGAGELLCRAFGRIHVQGFSANLLVDRRWGESHGNGANVDAVSMGATIRTDGDGFRVDPAHPPAATGPEVLVLGDSVTFASGVPAEASFVERVARRLPALRIRNAASLGYRLIDHRNLVRDFLPRHPDTRAAVLMMSLGDLSTRAEIAGGSRSPGLAARVNAFLRSRSKLLVFAKAVVLDPALRVFRADSALYDVDDATFERALAPFDEIATLCRERALPLVVVVLPYEVELRFRDDAALAPRRRLLAALAARDAGAVDALPRFLASPLAPDELFLFGDPVHLSPAGHALVADLLLAALAERGVSAAS